MARKQIKQKQKIHPVTYILLVIFIALFTTVIILSIPNQKHKFTNNVSIQLSKHDLKQVSQEDKNIYYLSQNDNKFENINVNSLYNNIKNVKNNQDLFLVYTGKLTDLETLKQFGVINKVFSAYTQKDYKLTGSDVNIEVNQKLLDATKGKIYYLEALEKKVEYKEEAVSYNNFEKLQELGLRNDPSQLPTILVFYKGKYVQLDNDHKFKVVSGKTAKEYIINFKNFLNHTILEEVIK